MSWAIITHNLDPVLFQIGPFALRWYALAYIGGLLLGWRYCRWLTQISPSKLTAEDFDDYLLWATLGVILGGRLGYILFYKPDYFLENPGEIFLIWQGGMSFHGGFLGVIVAGILFCKKRGHHPLDLGDIIACAAPIGLLFGRIANFINGELFGRAADPDKVPWAVIFTRTDETGIPRHPSQLYEAGLEGLLLLLLFFVMARAGALKHLGLLSGLFFIGYGAARFVVEFFRQPDAHLNFVWAGMTMGQLLSFPMLLIGLAVIFIFGRRRAE